MRNFIKSYDVKVWIVIKLGDLSLVSTNKDKNEKTPENGEKSIESTPSLENYTDEQMEII